MLIGVSPSVILATNDTAYLLVFREFRISYIRGA